MICSHLHINIEACMTTEHAAANPICC